MQQRRGTAEQWTAANPILSAGEIGFETDTNQFKIGDGSTAWASLSYFKNLEDLGGSLDDYILLTEKGADNGVATLDGRGAVPISQLINVIDSAPQTLDTLKELADSIADTNGLVNTAINTAISTEVENRNAAIDDAVLAEATARNTAIETAVGNAIDSVTAGTDEKIAQEVTNRNNAITAAVGASENTLNTTITTSISDAIDTLNTAVRTDLGQDISDAQSAAESFATQADSNLHTTVTSEIATAKSEAIASANSHSDTALSSHEADTTNIHGIADTSALATKTYADNAVSTHEADTTNVHGIADTAALATKTYADDKASAAETAAATSAASLYATKAAPTITGNATVENITVTGNLTVNGTTTSVSSTNLEVTDPIVYIGTGNSANSKDLGVVGHFDNGTYQHTGIVRDATDGKWKLFSGVTTEPTDVIDFTSPTYDTLRLGAVEFADGTQSKQGVPSITPISQKTASYTLSDLAERDTLIEISSQSATTVTIPADSSVNYPVGTTLDILQTASGQVTIAGAQGVTVNATPGLKLRTQWSSATLMKRAANTWVVYGDLSA